MKLLSVTYVVPHPEATSGASLVMYGQLTALAARHEITLLTFAAGGKAERKALTHLRSIGIEVHEVGGRWPTPFISWRRRIEHALRPIGARIRTTPSVHSMALTDPRMQHRISRLVDAERFDLVHVESIGFGNYDFGKRNPSILTEHEVGRMQETGRPDWQMYQPTIWAQFDRVQVFTRRDAEIVRKLKPEIADRVRINPFGIDLPPEADTRREDANTILFVGGFRHLSNVDAACRLATEIMPLLRTLSPGVRATIVGSHPPERIRALATADIEVRADVPAVEPFLEKAAVVVAPVRTGGGMRVKVLQAMAMGKAVVTTPLGAEGLAETSERPAETSEGLAETSERPAETSERPLLIAEDSRGLATLTAELLSSTEHRRRLGKQARAFVQAHHTWEAYVQRLEAIYAELAPGKGSP